MDETAQLPVTTAAENEDRKGRRQSEGGSFVQRSAGLSNDWKLDVREARKFDSSFPDHGTTRDSFPDQRTGGV